MVGESPSATVTSQFLGLVLLYTAQSPNRVIAFKLHCFVVYNVDPICNVTEIEALLTERHLHGTSAPERILQVLQLIQGELIKNSTIEINPKYQLPPESVSAYQKLGFTVHKSGSRKPTKGFWRKNVLKLTQCRNRILWGRFGFFLSFSS